MLRIPLREIERIRRHGESTYPREGCGILLGRQEDDLRIVHKAVPVRNMNAERPEDRFEFDPKEHLLVQKQARQEGIEVVGFFHSHPDHPARPSKVDLENAPWPGYSYMIVAVARGTAQDLNSYELAHDRSHFIQEEVETEHTVSEA